MPRNSHCKSKNRLSRATLIEVLESRQLLSAAVDMIAHPMMTASPAGGPGFPAGSGSIVGYTPTQLKGAYNISKISFAGVTGDGTGQTIAIINAFDNPKLVSSSNSSFSSSDLHKFDGAMGIADPPSFLKVNQNGGTSYPATGDSHWTNEAALDVEWIHAMAPKASIILVEAASAGLNDLIESGVEWAREQSAVSVINMSFASSEGPSETIYDSYLQTPTSHKGITFVAATGDNGAGGGYPAFSPNVLAVGATTLNVSGNNYGSETGLNTSGGGISKYESKPSYQFSITQSSTNRTIPDVALDGNANTGVAVYDSFNGGSSTPWYKVGGTSLSSPIWSAMIAIADQGRVKLGLSTMNGATQTLPRIYTLGLLGQGNFHDITSGSNGYSAGTGYDLVTGFGTPIANVVIPDLAGGNKISGVNFSDKNGDGTQNNGEAGLYNWGAYLDLYQTLTYKGLDPAAFTSSTGAFTFNDVPGGTYHLTENPLPGWKRISPSTYTSVTVTYGSNITGKNIAVQQQFGTISGYEFYDANRNGRKDTGEAALYNWGLYLDINNDGRLDAGDKVAFTDKNGYFQFTGLAQGVTYYLRQDSPASFTRTTSLPITINLLSSLVTNQNIGYVQP